MIDRYSFLDIVELVEQRGHIKKVSKTTRGEKRQRWGSWRQRASFSRQSGKGRKGNDTGGACGRKNRVKSFL